MSNNSETVRDTRNVSINHDYETGVALSDSVNKACVKRALAEKSQWCHNRFKIKPHYLANHASRMKSYYRTLSGSHGRSFRIRHEKSPETPPSGGLTMTSDQLAIKPRYLGNHASQIKSYYRTPSVSHVCSFRIRHEKSPEAPPSGEITMKSHPPCNKTSLSRKPCIAHEMLVWITIRKSCSLFQNPSWKFAWSAP